MNGVTAMTVLFVSITNPTQNANTERAGASHHHNLVVKKSNKAPMINVGLLARLIDHLPAPGSTRSLIAAL